MGRRSIFSTIGRGISSARDVERGEQLNAGIVVYCRARDFLAARVALDPARLRALAADADVEAIDRALAVIPLIAAGDPRGGPIARLPPSERFHWLTAPRSTVTQTSPVHAGLCEDPAQALDRLFAAMVLPP
jgi:hypothetical protein